MKRKGSSRRDATSRKDQRKNKRVYRPDSGDRGTACESSGRQGCAGVRGPRVRGSAGAKEGAPLRRSARQTLYCVRCWSTIRTSGLILARFCPELKQNRELR